MKRIKTDLNLCPLCGHIANVWQGWNDEFQVECAYCNVQSLSFYEMNRAIDNWNSQSKKSYTRTEKKRQKLVTVGQNLGHHLWDYNSKGNLMKLENRK